MKITLLGSYQPRNAAVVLTALNILKRQGVKIETTAIKHGLEQTKWQGRFEIISKDPLVIFDGAHNPQGISAAVESIKLYFKNQKIYLMTGVLKDKDYTAIARELSTIAERAYTITPDSPRALDAKEYALVLQGAGITAEPCDNIAKGLELAKEQAQRDGVPLVCLGSLYVYHCL